VTTAALRRPRVAALTRPAVATPLLLGALALLSILVRTREIDSGLWVDEGLSYGIADRPLSDIPGTLRQDGSPPLYYLVLHLYTRVFGVRSEVALHLLSLAFAVLAIPVAYAFATSLFGRRAGFLAAALAATNPYLNQYAQETRMYSLVVLLGIVTTATFVGAFLLDRGRRWTIAFALSQTALLYTHNWGLFLAAGLAVAFLVLAREKLREGLLAAAIVAVLYAPWIPSFLFQAAHTGAPWASPPDLADLYQAPQDLLGYTGLYLLLIAGGAGLATLGRRSRETRIALALALAAVTALVVPWLLSQASPAWSFRYLAILLGPILLLAALATSRAGRIGIAAVVLTMLIAMGKAIPSTKSNVHSVTAAIAPSLAAGDYVISTQPEQVPVLHYYLHRLRLRYATLFGAVRDVGVTDWRDGVDRLRRATPARDLEPVLATVPSGRRVALVTPDFSVLGRWKAPWSELVRARSLEWEDAMRRDPRFRVVTIEPPNPVARPNELRATVFVRR
jgi:MFS family permease